MPHDLMKMFEKEYPEYRKDKEPRELWKKGHIYQHGELNALFKAYQKGYAFAKCVILTGN